MSRNSSKSNSKMSWLDAKKFVNDLRSECSILCDLTPSSVTFRKINSNMLRMYFLSAVTSGGECTILYSDIDTNLSKAKFSYTNLVDTMSFLCCSENKSREQQLLNERKRISNFGITSYLLNNVNGSIIVPHMNTLYQFCEGDGKTTLPMTNLSGKKEGAIMNPKICPKNSDFIAYCCKNDIWLLNCKKRESYRLTYSSEESTLSAGIPSYVIQEEFNRYEGFWWQPNDVYRILYEEVDDEAVDVISFPSVHSEFLSHEEFRFPRPGCVNSKSVLKLVEFRSDSTNDCSKFQTWTLLNLAEYLDGEYLVQCGWSTDGSFPWAQILNRKQQKLDIVIFLLKDDSYKMMKIYSETSTTWISVTKSLRFLSGLSDMESSGAIKFIWASEQTGFNHLYVITVQLANDMNSAKVIGETVLTSGNWLVNKDAIWVDFDSGLVYFIANRESVLEDHLYVVSIDRPNEIKLLTETGYSHTVFFDKDFTVFLSVKSSVKFRPESDVYKIDKKCSTNVADFHVRLIGTLVSLRPNDRPEDFAKFVPDIYCCPSSSGYDLYAAVLKPHDYVPGRRYPTVLNIYGGPEAQIVTNSFRGIRYFKLHMLTSCGFCVVNIDSRGSSNRGKDFETYIQYKFGLVEIQDQLEVLNYLNYRLKMFDMDRLGLLGWSYGGYLSLMGIANYGDVFKVAVAGAPVTNWLWYDTGYTERYMGLVNEKKDAYKNSSVLKYVDKFPDEENRLLIVHGQMDENVHYFHTNQLIWELEKCQKPFQLKMYPEERHSFRNAYASRDFEINLLMFLKNYL